MQSRVLLLSNLKNYNIYPFIVFKQVKANPEMKYMKKGEHHRGVEMVIGKGMPTLHALYMILKQFKGTRLALHVLCSLKPFEEFLSV